MIRFIDRFEELETLKKDWNRLENAFIVIYGRRRIGKTRLIEEFLRNKKGISYIADDTSKKVQINELKLIVANYLKDDFLAKQDILDWSSLFSYFTKVLPREDKMYIWVDEFTYIIKNDSSMISVLQKFIDGFIRKSNIFLIVSGSLFGLMSEKVLAYSSPLYGRRSRDMLVEEIPVKYAYQFLDMGFEDSLKTLLTIGGIPEYLLIATKYKTYNEFINTEFLIRNGYFYREPYFLLSQEFKEIRIYFSILNAIAYGNNKPTEIANFVGLNAREIYPYLELIINFGFIKRETSLVNQKKGIYLIKDAFLDFWFNLVYRNRDDIEKGLYRLNLEDLNKLLGKRFEIFILNNFNLFFNFRSINRWWHKDKEIDIVALNEDKKEMLFAECKWQDRVNALKIVTELSEKSKYVKWNNEDRKESYAIFAKSFNKKINELNGKKVYCYDLKDIKKLLR